MSSSLLNFTALGAALANYYGIPLGNLDNNLGGILGKGLETAIGAFGATVVFSALSKDGIKDILSDKIVYITALHFGLVATLADLIIPDNQMIQTALVVIVPLVILNRKGSEKMTLIE